jgi:hypothetical protein
LLSTLQKDFKNWRNDVQYSLFFWLFEFPSSSSLPHSHWQCKDAFSLAFLADVAWQEKSFSENQKLSTHGLHLPFAIQNCKYKSSMSKNCKHKSSIINKNCKHKSSMTNYIGFQENSYLFYFDFDFTHILHGKVSVVCHNQLK